MCSILLYCMVIPSTCYYSNLDSQTKEIYRKNIQIRDALEMHTEDAERLKKVSETIRITSVHTQYTA